MLSMSSNVNCEFSTVNIVNIDVKDGKEVDTKVNTGTQSHNRSVPKSGTLKGCVHTGTLEITSFRSKKWNHKKVIRKVERCAIVPFPYEQSIFAFQKLERRWNGTIVFPCERGLSIN